jgi:3-oxoacyl-[acyl-carrier protein] reductase
MTNSRGVALITGGSRGIGAAIVRELAASRFNVVINYINNCHAAGELAVDVSSRFKVETLPVRADVSCFSDVNEMVRWAREKFGRIDILVNNAGITRDALFARMTEEEWDEVINTNLKGVFNCSKAVLKIMQQQRGGRMINISSISGQRGQTGQANYAAAKAGVIAFSKTLARELARWHINVNVVIPCFTDTDMTRQLPVGAREGILAQIPRGRPGRPEDVAGMVNYLASGAASYISGQVFNVDCRVI